ncbi:MAG: HEAT repeat domain-containing protein [Candidatus Lokiarchaeota archaeon]|nr:HEAT repeat domain-containing protein [Candidatus Lokiarchaeota archaeon]
MPDENLVRKAIEMVAEGNISEAIKVLLKSLKENTDWSVRSYSAQILGELGKISLDNELKTQMVVEMIETLKNENDGWVREALTKAFGKIGINFSESHPDLIEQIIPRLIYVLINDEHEGAKGSAAKSLGDIGRVAPDLILKEDDSLIEQKSHLDHIAKRLELDESWIVRYYTAYAIGEIGTVKPRVVSKYLDKLKFTMENDEDNGVRNAAQEAYDKIKNALEE